MESARKTLKKLTCGQCGTALGYIKVTHNRASFTVFCQCDAGYIICTDENGDASLTEQQIIRHPKFVTGNTKQRLIKLRVMRKRLVKKLERWGKLVNLIDDEIKPLLPLIKEEQVNEALAEKVVKGTSPEKLMEAIGKHFTPEQLAAALDKLRG